MANRRRKTTAKPVFAARELEGREDLAEELREEAAQRFEEEVALGSHPVAGNATASEVVMAVVAAAPFASEKWRTAELCEGEGGRGSAEGGREGEIAYARACWC